MSKNSGNLVQPEWASHPLTHEKRSRFSDTEKVHLKRVKEMRIQFIMAIMRPFVDANGNRSWTGGVRKSLCAAWNIPDGAMKPLSAEASKRLAAELANPDMLVAGIGANIEKALIEIQNRGSEIRDRGQVWEAARKLALAQAEREAASGHRKKKKAGPSAADAKAALKEFFPAEVKKPVEESEKDLNDLAEHTDASSETASEE